MTTGSSSELDVPLMQIPRPSLIKTGSVQVPFSTQDLIQVTVCQQSSQCSHLSDYAETKDWNLKEEVGPAGMAKKEPAGKERDSKSGLICSAKDL